MPMDDKAWEEAKKAHPPDSLTITVPENDWDPEFRALVKRPTKSVWKRVRTMMADDKQRPDALEQLALDCVLATSDGEWAEALKVRPALAETIGGRLAEIAGFTDGARVKK